MESLRTCEVEVGRGLVGDRYATGNGYWSGRGDCQVTLIEAEVLSAAEAQLEASLSAGEHRRNLVTRGTQLAALAGTRFRIGTAEFAFEAVRPPCRYLESLVGPGLRQALADGRGGICARVVRAGRIEVGDVLTVLGG